MIHATQFSYRVEDGVAVITLARPDKLNALTFASYAELRDAFRDLEREDEVGAVVLTGTGRAFCSGGDVEDIIGPLLKMDSPELYAFTRMTCDLILNMRRLSKPIVGAINDVSCGAGAVMTAACDFRLAAPNAKIAFLFAKVGLCGADMGSAYLLPRLIGHARAAELLFFGDFIDAAEAERIGLYNKVVPGEQLLAEALRWAKRLADGPRFANGLTKRMLDHEATQALEAAMEGEAQAQALCMRHPDYLEGYRAFTEKRAPDFRGAREARRGSER
ncbi:MAG: enoyl-CoA hydratase family protein [Planctomycetes bacterium]|nr:enoyl-CoA hydratase family protein [Planctomycetota bacterium]